MSRRPRHRLITVLFALCSLLFMQLAVAAYACPGQAERLREVAAMAAMEAAGLPCAGEMAAAMDEAQPGLCHAHCQSAQQSVDKVPSLSPAAMLGAGFVLVLPPRRLDPPPPALQAPLLHRSTAPPIAVRHCCFRI